MNLSGLRALLFDNPVYFNLTPDPKNLSNFSDWNLGLPRSFYEIILAL